MEFKLTIVIITVILCNRSHAFESGHRGECVKYVLNGTFNCDEVFKMFHKCAGIFVKRALENSDPFTLCTDGETYHTYQNLAFNLNLLQTTQDPSNLNVKCSDEYMNKNSMGVISRVLDLTTSLWNGANCDDCYVNTSLVNQTFSNHTTEFMKLRDKYKTCTDRSNTTEICSECEQTYTQMNIIFNHHVEKGHTVCFDLEDIMNKTRLEWSTVYKCCKDKRDSLTAFYSLFSTILSLTVVFYCSVYCFGSRCPMEETIDAQQIVPCSPDPSTAPSTSSSAASSTNGARKKPAKPAKPVLSLNTEASDDDEPIINDNLIHLND